VWRRAEEEKAAEEEPGIQNQKQEPHTKMWGKTMFQTTNQLYIDLRFIHVIVYLHVIVDCFRS